MAVFTIFHDDSDPGWTMAEFFDLDGLIHNEAVGAQPASRTNRHILHLPVAHIADVGLGVDRQRSRLPGIHLEPGHVNKSLFRGQVVGETDWV